MTCQFEEMSNSRHFKQAARTACLALFGGLLVFAAPASRAAEVVVTGSRIQVGLPGASTSVIGEEEIEKSPARTLPELLSYEAGVQSRDLFGNVAAARATVDMRGFGQTGKENTLILVNGRRMNDLDLAAIDFSSIPIDAIERIEITRGQAAGVLYGDGAIGGAINIITKQGVDAPFAASGDIAYGSNNYWQGNLSGAVGFGPWSINGYGTVIEGDGYRDNNEIEEKSLVADLRYSGKATDYYANFSFDDQHLGLPGPRLVSPPINELRTDRRGTSTPLDFANQIGIAGTLGFTHQVSEDTVFILDGGARTKEQESLFDFGAFGSNAIDSRLTTLSLTPRLEHDNQLAGMATTTITGLDYYYTNYDSDRAEAFDSAPIHRYEATQHSFALYMQNTLEVDEATSISLGFRGQGIVVDMTDRFDPTAPGASIFDAPQPPADGGEFQYAFNIGIDRQLDEMFGIFGRFGRNFRIPTVDERVATFTGRPLDAIETQTSWDAEVGGRFEYGPLFVQSSVFLARLEDEILFDPTTFLNVNLDPTRRIGWETSVNYQVTQDLRFKGALTYIDARFVDGPFEGKEVPLVAPWNTSLSAFVDLDGLLETPLDALDLATTFTYYSEQFAGNDNANVQPEIPAYGLVDVKLTGRLGNFSLGAQVNNLLDEKYYNVAFASAFTPGAFSAFPLPGRTFLITAGLRL